MGDGTADGTSEGESRVEVDAGKLLRVDGSLNLLLDSVELVAASGDRSRAHFGGM